jgi:hypothetical protein
MTGRCATTCNYWATYWATVLLTKNFDSGTPNDWSKEQGNYCAI